MRSDILYIALVLDEKSSEELLEVAEDVVGQLDDFEPRFLCHHMTMAFWKQLDEDFLEYCENVEGETFDLIVTHIGISDKAVAVKVETDADSLNSLKHVTLAVNLNKGGKPVDSNHITQWEEFDRMRLKGKVKFFYK